MNRRLFSRLACIPVIGCLFGSAHARTPEFPRPGPGEDRKMFVIWWTRWATPDEKINHLLDRIEFLESRLAWLTGPLPKLPP